VPVQLGYILSSRGVYSKVILFMKKPYKRVKYPYDAVVSDVAGHPWMDLFQTSESLKG
jgi:hypothetical protein